jgi:histidine triad (HIT) family protein
MASVFTKIINGEIPCYKIYEDEKTLAFLDINPEAVGHTLVVPKVEIDKIYDLPDEDYMALMQTVKKVSRHMEEALGKRTLWKVIGVDVPHAHVHLIPYDENWEQGREIKLTTGEMEELRKQLAF